MVRRPHALLIWERASPFQIPALGIRCDADEVPHLMGSAQPTPCWITLAAFDGSACPYPCEGARTQQLKVENRAHLYTTATQLVGIVGNTRIRPSIWIAAGLETLDVSAAAEPGAPKRHPWVRAIAAWREHAYPEIAHSAPELWDQLLSQKKTPTFVSGYWGPLARLPIHCALGEQAPRN